MGPLLSALCNHLTPNRYLHLWLKIIIIQPAGGVNGSLFQNSCLKNPLDRGAWGLQSIGLQRVRHDWAHIHTIHLESGYLPGMRWYQIHNSPEMLQNWKMKDDLWGCDLFWGALYQPQKGQWVGCWESTWMSYVTHGPQVIPPEQMQTETSSLAATTKTLGCIHRTCIQLHVCLRVSCPPKGMSLPKVWLPPSQLLPLFQMYCQSSEMGKN